MMVAIPRSVCGSGSKAARDLRMKNATTGIDAGFTGVARKVAAWQ
jgi:hypothetical protein